MSIYLGEDKVAGMGAETGDKIKRQMLSTFDVTTNSNGYAAIPSDIKSTLPSGSTVLGYFLNTWSNVNPKVAFNITNNGAWVLSDPNVTITGIQLFVLYI